MSVDDPRVLGYRDGHKAGYEDGLDDGRPQGFADAKWRAYAAIDGADIDETARRRVKEALVNVLGRQT